LRTNPCAPADAAVEMSADTRAALRNLGSRGENAGKNVAHVKFSSRPVIKIEFH
jgi:hypothetical protein